MTGMHFEGIRAPVICSDPESLANGALQRRALFLDRDGVINVDHGYVCSVRRTDFVPGIFDLAKEAVKEDYLVIVVTNQAGIARGYYSENRFVRYTRWVHGVFKREGALIHATYYCPHRPDEEGCVICECRKPAPGMLLSAARRFGLDLAGSVMVGDKTTDFMASRSAGVGRFWHVTDTESDAGECGRISKFDPISRRRILTECPAK